MHTILRKRKENKNDNIHNSKVCRQISLFLLTNYIVRTGGIAKLQHNNFTGICLTQFSLSINFLK